MKIEKSDRILLTNVSKAREEVVPGVIIQAEEDKELVLLFKVLETARQHYPGVPDHRIVVILKYEEYAVLQIVKVEDLIVLNHIPDQALTLDWLSLYHEKNPGLSMLIEGPDWDATTVTLSIVDSVGCD